MLALKEDEVSVRARAAASLGKLGDIRAVEHLIEALGDSHSGVRKAAAVALGELGEPEAEEPLRGLLDSESESLRAAAGEAIRKIKLALLPPGSRESNQ
jgi:HEAT repeat protein